VNSKVKILDQILNVIQDGDTVATTGFAGANLAEEILVNLDKKFLETGRPKNLTSVFASGQGNWKDGGIEHFAHEGMLKRVIGGHFDTCPTLVQLINANKIEAYNFPQGVICHLYRAIAANKPGEITKVGLKTFIDPRMTGGKMNSITTEDLIQVIEVNNDEYLLYKSFTIDVAIIRGTTSDELGNISMEDEAILSEGLALAQATKASGGKVIVQVKNISQAGTLDAQQVQIPGSFVDAVYVSAEPEKYHRQTWTKFNSPVFSGHQKIPVHAIEPMLLDERKVIARRAALELMPNTLTNLGIGMPEGVAGVAAEEGLGDHLILTLESGTTGGIPAPGLSFGAAFNPWAIIDMTSQFDFYDGGGLDIAFLGLAQTNRRGDVNVSKFGPKIAGCGGFINISQNTKRIIYCGTFTAGGLKLKIGDGRLEIVKEGKYKKFIKDIEQVTFSGEYASQTEQTVLYITERAVFQLSKDGLVLIEIAPGIDLVRDVLEQMGFEPLISPNLKVMDPVLFSDGLIGLRDRVQVKVGEV